MDTPLEILLPLLRNKLGLDQVDIKIISYVPKSKYTESVILAMECFNINNPNDLLALGRSELPNLNFGKSNPPEKGISSELSLYSDWMGSKLAHTLGMIDFSNEFGNDSAFIATGRECVFQQIANELKTELHIFKTTHSFHGYYLTDKLFNETMGDLLLLSPGIVKAIDTRWVGHSINKGFAVLRWSNNDKTKWPDVPRFYKSYRPKMIFRSVNSISKQVLKS